MLIDIYSKVEAVIEFEEEKQWNQNEKNKIKIEEIINVLEKEIIKREKIRNVENFVQIVIAGTTNAGKSSLFNLLLGHDRTIVHSEPGTTRDIISEQCGYVDIKHS